MDPPFLLFMFRGCHAFLPDLCSLVVTCWEGLALMCIMFSWVFVFFQFGVILVYFLSIIRKYQNLKPLLPLPVSRIAF